MNAIRRLWHWLVDPILIETITGAGGPPPPLSNGDTLVVFNTDENGRIIHWQVRRRRR